MLPFLLKLAILAEEKSSSLYSRLIYGISYFLSIFLKMTSKYKKD